LYAETRWRGGSTGNLLSDRRKIKRPAEEGNSRGLAGEFKESKNGPGGASLMTIKTEENGGIGIQNKIASIRDKN